MSTPRYPTFNGLLTMQGYKILTSTHTSRAKLAERLEARGLIEITSRKQVRVGNVPHVLITYSVTEYGRRILEDVHPSG